MRKGLKILFISMIIILLVGCNNKDTNKEITKKCTLSQNQSSNGYTLDSKYEIHSKNGYVTKVITKETVESESEEVREYFKSTLEDSYKSTNEKYGGYTYSITENDNKVISNVTINYSKMDIEKFIEDNSQMSSYVKNNKLTLDGIVAIYEALGAICK